MSEFTFKLPDLGEGTVESEIAEWMVKVGDHVAEEDPICSMLTDKAAVELSAPVTGKVVKLAGDVGDVIAVGATLIVFETTGEAVVAEKADEASEPATAAEPGPAHPNQSSLATTPASGDATDGKVKTSPSIRRLAREAGVDLTEVAASGPRGRILKADFEAFLAGQEPAAGELPAQARRSPLKNRAVGSTEVKVIGLRRKIAERMQQAKQQVPHFAYVEEVDVTPLESLRQFLNSRKSAGEERLTLLPFIGLALIRALREFPQCNAHYDAERGVLIRHHPVHLGIATQTPDGLKVPVVRHAEARGLEDLAAEIRRVSSAARDNSASRDELSGSTITLTSLGKLGGIASTPIINIPEVAIIGVNKMVERPVVLNGQVVVRQVLNLSSSFDHRFVDGYDAAAMIQQLKLLLEQPATIFMD